MQRKGIIAMMLSHKEFYTSVMHNAAEHIQSLFEGCQTSVRDLIGKDDIEHEHDLHKLVAFIEAHGNCAERAAAALASAEWVQAINELRESGDS